MFRRRCFCIIALLLLVLTSCTPDNDKTITNSKIQPSDFGYYYDQENKIGIIDCGEDIFLHKCDVSDEKFVLPTLFEQNTKINHVGESVFCGNSKLVSVTIPDGYETIGYFSFMNCANLETVYIGKDLREIGEGAFEESNSIEEFVVSKENPYLYSVYGCVMQREGEVLVATNGRIPEETKHIYQSVFRSKQNISNIILPESVDYIGAYAFKDSSLSSIQLPSGLVTIEKYSFANTNLKEIFIPEGLESVGECIFDGVENLVVYCEASEKPSGWDDRWLDGCNGCQVFWGIS